MPETTTQEVDKTKQWEWTLKFMGYAINECSIAAYEACHTFTIWKDYNLKLVDHAEFAQMVSDGKIAPPETWWTIKPGQHGLVCKTDLVRYSRDWENMSNCYQDFVRGWQACEKQQQLAASVPDKKSKTKKEQK